MPPDAYTVEPARAEQMMDWQRESTLVYGTTTALKLQFANSSVNSRTDCTR